MQENIRIALIPAYEPSETLIDLTGQLIAEGFQVVVIDDGSGGKYKKVFKAVSMSENSTVITHNTNMGKGRALKTGLAYINAHYSTGSVIVTLDADGQHSVEDAIRVYDAASQTVGCLVLGSRKFDGDVPARSRFGNTVTRFVYRSSTGASVRDTQTGLRAFGAELIPFMLSVDGERYEYEMNILLECTRQDIPIREVDIETVYFDNNAASHFNTLKDSFRIYSNILKFAASSFTGFLVDYGMFGIMSVLTQGLSSAVSIPLSNIAARAVSSSVNYTINKRIVFKNKDSIAKTATQYFTLVACILLGNTLFLSYMVENLHILGRNYKHIPNRR